MVTFMTVTDFEFRDVTWPWRHILGGGSRRVTNLICVFLINSSMISTDRSLHNKLLRQEQFQICKRLHKQPTAALSNPSPNITPRLDSPPYPLKTNQISPHRSSRERSSADSWPPNPSLWFVDLIETKNPSKRFHWMRFIMEQHLGIPRRSLF